MFPIQLDPIQSRGVHRRNPGDEKCVTEISGETKIGKLGDKIYFVNKYVYI